MMEQQFSKSLFGTHKAEEERNDSVNWESFGSQEIILLEPFLRDESDNILFQRDPFEGWQE